MNKPALKACTDASQLSLHEKINQLRWLPFETIESWIANRLENYPNSSGDYWRAWAVVHAMRDMPKKFQNAAILYRSAARRNGLTLPDFDWFHKRVNRAPHASGTPRTFVEHKGRGALFLNQDALEDYLRTRNEFRFLVPRLVHSEGFDNA